MEGGSENILPLIIEVTGEKKKGKEAKVATARDLWVLAVNNGDELRRKYKIIEIGIFGSYIRGASCKSLKKGPSVILSLSKNYGKSNS